MRDLDLLKGGRLKGGPRHRALALLLACVAVFGAGAALAAAASGGGGYPDVRGTYTGGVCIGGTLAACEAAPQYPHTKVIGSEDFTTGSVSNPGLTGQITGCVLVTTVTSGSYTSTETETISADGNTLTGSFSDSNGHSGPDFDFRTSGGPTSCPVGRSSATAVKCVAASSPALTCTATVSDSSGQSPAEVPTGTVSFTTTAGDLADPSCQLAAVSGSAAACSVGFTPPDSASPPQITASYPGDSNFSKSQGVVSIPVGTVVNSTDDTALKADATSCDTGKTVTDSAGNTVPECTLRAAIQYVDKLSGGGDVKFDIPGSGVPKISPASALPAVTVAANIDATTQAGGWVQLNGASAGSVNGLELDGNADVVRGLVIDGFSGGDGILINGGSGATVAGNRIGTDVTGQSADPSKIGVEVDAPDATIGGTSGTSTSGCTGDCNLISGNTDTDVDDVLQYVADKGAGALGLSIQGNWIGINAAGDAIPTGSDTFYDVRLETFHAWGEGSKTVTLGGVTSRPGTAPGNVIAASNGGVAATVEDAAEDSSYGGGKFPTEKDRPPVIEGNTLGLNPSGQKAVGHGKTGVSAYIAEVGGKASGTGNVISGFQTGAELRDALFDQNLVGTNVEGTAAVGNGTGVTGDGQHPSILIDNVISGNSTGDKGLSLAYGNLVGLASDGEAALPNTIGVEGSPFFEAGEYGGCHTDPCNVISGNLGAGILLKSGGVIYMKGTFLGTDRTGTRAIPNGTGIRLDDFDLHPVKSDEIDTRGNDVHEVLNVLLSEYLFPATEINTPGVVLAIGGYSHAVARDRCEYPCDLIAGNHGAGISISLRVGARSNSRDVLAGNVFGRNVDAKPLPNGGPDLQISGPARGDSLYVGGDLSLGNVFAGDHSPLIELTGTPEVSLTSNLFTLTGTGKLLKRGVSPGAPILNSATRDGSLIHLSGSIETPDIFGSGEEVELYAGDSCDGGTHRPIGLVHVHSLTGEFSYEISTKRLDRADELTALLTTADHVTSRFSRCVAIPH